MSYHIGGDPIGGDEPKPRDEMTWADLKAMWLKAREAAFPGGYVAIEDFILEGYIRNGLAGILPEIVVVPQIGYTHRGKNRW